MKDAGSLRNSVSCFSKSFLFTFTIFPPCVKFCIAAIFFVSVGMLIDPHSLLEHWNAILVITLVTIVGKAVSCFGGSLLTGES
ncbi:MAG: cation:proton antiporter domain-containing protein, partial [Kaistella sp.]